MTTEVNVEVVRSDEGALTAAVNGAVVPLLDYELATDEDTAEPLLKLLLAPSSFAVRNDAKANDLPVPSAPKAHLKVWGAPDRDPREGLPGWPPPSIGEQVAANAEAGA
ncbi:hypothetical protein [Paractinoplanes toevensis]|uniref:Uncharacterized protein n=1 Tax=Paractinoplanes toevensis TaxID=571911 RepID=A0A919T5J1_9ACTN|nr:hypothetical protein [Actinoplanes toevensis]GIM88752.1 hypothetical protein Ato02nite_005450 [Actinoplanes toevensis]